jgi:hypothetical protein
MAVQFNFIISEIIAIVVLILALRPTLKKWKDSKNRMYIAVSFYAVAVIIYSFLTLFSFIYEIDTNIYVIGWVKIGYILGYILFIVQFEFILYLRRLKKFYTLPFVVTFYLVVGNLLSESAMPFIIYAVLLTFIPAYLLLRDGKRNRNGLAIGMGLLFLFWGIGQSIQVPVFFQLCKLLGAISFYLGTIGFYEKYVFPNQEEEAKIMGTWISKLVVKD